MEVVVSVMPSANCLKALKRADERQQFLRLSHPLEVGVDDAHSDGKEEADGEIGQQAVAQEAAHPPAVAPPEGLAHQRGEPVGEAQAEEDGDVEHAVHERGRRQVGRRETADHDVVGQAHGHHAQLAQHDGHPHAGRFPVMFPVCR